MIATESTRRTVAVARRILDHFPSAEIRLDCFQKRQAPYEAMNYETLLANGTIKGNERTIYAAASDFMLDGERLGNVDFEMASASSHETYLPPKRHEVDIAAYLLARSGLRNISIATRDERGLPLESPDLDVSDGNNHWGFEVATGIESKRAQSEREEDRILTAIREQLDANETLHRALGSVHLFVKLESDDEPLSKLISRRIIAELTRFIVTNDFARIPAGEFKASCPTLQSRGAWFEILEEGPYFSVGHGRSVVDPSHRADVVTRVLDNHRTSAAKYRHAANWFAIQISDVFDVFRPTLTRIAEIRPQISPFHTVFVSNSEKRVILLREKDGEVYVMELP